MANFDSAFNRVLVLEGGWSLHTVPGDLGGMTYAGIARTRWPMWKGWVRVDAGQFDAKLKAMVRTFFKREFWDRIWGDDIGSDEVAYHIYSFAVNSGRRNAIRISQRIVGAKSDGIFGPKTFSAINSFIMDEKDEEIFTLRYSLLKVFYFKDICRGDKRRRLDKIFSNMKFLPGWINRVRRGIS